MSTNINISVGDSKLLAQARLQQNANRQAQLEKEANRRLKSEAEIERVNALAAQGKDANGNPINGTSIIQPKIELRPAANRLGEAFVRFLPPTVLLAESPLDPSDQPDFQALVRRWWTVQTNKISSTVGLGDYVVSEELLNNPQYPLLNAVGNSLTLSTANLYTNTPGANDSSIFGEARTSVFAPSLSTVRELIFSGTLQVPPLGIEFTTTNGIISARSWTDAIVVVSIEGSNPYIQKSFTVRVNGSSVLPTNVWTGTEFVAIQMLPSSLVNFKYSIKPEGTSYFTANNQTYTIANEPIWSPTQTFYMSCRIIGSINREFAAVGEVIVPFPSPPDGLGAFGTVKAAFK